MPTLEFCAIFTFASTKLKPSSHFIVIDILKQQIINRYSSLSLELCCYLSYYQTCVFYSIFYQKSYQVVIRSRRDRIITGRVKLDRLMSYGKMENDFPIRNDRDLSHRLSCTMRS